MALCCFHAIFFIFIVLLLLITIVTKEIMYIVSFGNSLFVFLYKI